MSNSPRPNTVREPASNPRPNTVREPACARGLAPVVGIALLIAITVVLAALISGQIFGLGVGDAAAPQATLSFSVVDNGSTVELIHEGGDRLPANEVLIKDENGAVVGELDEDVTSGDRRAIVDLDDHDADLLRVVWQDSDRSSSRVLATFRL